MRTYYESRYQHVTL